MWTYKEREVLQPKMAGKSKGKKEMKISQVIMLIQIMDF
jgi:hypothetical protein